MLVILDIFQDFLGTWLTLFLMCFGLSYWCYFVKIHCFLIVKYMVLLVSNKILYDGVAVFNVYFSFKFEKKYIIMIMKNRIMLFLLWSLLFKGTKKVYWDYLAFYNTLDMMSPFSNKLCKNCISAQSLHQQDYRQCWVIFHV